MVKMGKMKSALFVMCLLVVFGLGVASFVNAGSAPDCPTKSNVEGMIMHTFNRPIKVVSVKKSEVSGLCEAVVSLNGQKRILYTDKTGEYIVNGQIFRIKDRQNITRNTIQELNKFTMPQLKTLDNLVAFEEGKGEKAKSFYFVTDPMCPYCKRAEQIFEPLIKEGKIKVKFLLFPLRFHKGAKEQSISIICDKKGLEGLKSQYKSDNQCEAGKKKVEDTIKFLQQKGITGTPTYIFSDGKFHSGVLQKGALLKRLGINQ